MGCLSHFLYIGNKREFFANMTMYTKMQLGSGIRKRARMSLRVKIPARDFSTSKGG